MNFSTHRKVCPPLLTFLLQRTLSHTLSLCVWQTIALETFKNSWIASRHNSTRGFCHQNILTDISIAFPLHSDLENFSRNTTKTCWENPKTTHNSFHHAWVFDALVFAYQTSINIQLEYLWYRTLYTGSFNDALLYSTGRYQFSNDKFIKKQFIFLTLIKWNLKFNALSLSDLLLI